MKWTIALRRATTAGLAVAVALLFVTDIRAEQPVGGQKRFREPVFRVVKNVGDNVANQQNKHPLDPALRIAHDALRDIQANIHDYTATLIKRERVNGKLGEYEQMFIKVRNRKVRDGRVVVPLSAYLKFEKPSSKAGREVVWVEGKNDNKLCAHEKPGSILNIKRWWLHPEGSLALNGTKYPIWEIGIENLTAKLIERGTRDRKQAETQVKYYENAKIEGRLCNVIKVIHPHPRDHFDYHIATIYLDKEYGVPVRYAAWMWPTKPGTRPPLEEEYTYTNVKLNVGLTDRDFDPDNPEYNFP